MKKKQRLKGRYWERKKRGGELQTVPVDRGKSFIPALTYLFLGRRRVAEREGGEGVLTAVLTEEEKKWDTLIFRIFYREDMDGAPSNAA